MEDASIGIYRYQFEKIRVSINYCLISKKESWYLWMNNPFLCLLLLLWPPRGWGQASASWSTARTSSTGSWWPRRPSRTTIRRFGRRSILIHKFKKYFFSSHNSNKNLGVFLLFKTTLWNSNFKFVNNLALKDWHLLNRIENLRPQKTAFYFFCFLGSIKQFWWAHLWAF